MGERRQPPALALTGVVVCAGGRAIVDVASLTIDRGEVLALIGPNGAGKSTLLQVAALLKRPDRGAVAVEGEIATKRNSEELRKRIGMVFQSPLLFDVRVLTNAMSGLRFHGAPRREAQERARFWLARFGVDHLARRGVRGLSAGEAQRVSLARAFATEPSVLLLDEPFAALDAPSRAALLPEVATTLRETRTGAIVVTHHLAEAHVLADRVAVMFDGRIVQIGPVEELFANPATEQVRDFLTQGRLGGHRT